MRVPKLRRVGLGTLANLRLPAVPPQMNALFLALRELLDEMLLVGESIDLPRNDPLVLILDSVAQRRNATLKLRRLTHIVSASMK